jgi:homoserine O-acetyltransferase
MRCNVGHLPLWSGLSLPDVTVAYTCYGQLSAKADNAILVTHGYTASHHMLAHGADRKAGVAEGSWAPLIGPGKPLDTSRYFIVCSNMLGSSYGTTGPGTINPDTGHAYGSDFPDIRLADIVEVQRRLLVNLGVQHLKAVVGPSYGGFQALQWALDHPDWVDNIGVVLSAPYLPPSDAMSLPGLLTALARAPHWQRGDGQASLNDADSATLHAALAVLRESTLKTYGMDTVLAAQGLTPLQRAQCITTMAGTWAHEFNAHSLVTLLRAALAFDVRPHLTQVSANVLYVTANSDQLFPPDSAVLHAMSQTSSNRPLEHVNMNTPFGHQASGPAHALWSQALKKLLNS